MSDQRQRSIGERVLESAVRLAAATWDSRLIAAYALGSLAHGGFSIHVSDIDLGLVLSDPLQVRDPQTVETLSSTLLASGVPMADRLSIFWGSQATLSGEATGGRFPALDRLDLKEYGHLLVGQDIRSELPTPSLRELVVEGASFALRSLSTPEVTAILHDPTTLASAGVRTLTKRVLFPVRFLFTAQTGQIGRNDTAVEYFTSRQTGPAADLARNACAWRERPPDADDRTVLASLETGLLPLYRLFLDDYTPRLRQYGALDLAYAFQEWRRHLE
ncbi:MAG: hypothetical protein OJF49_002066 [Ktedonobacterales bacterium]|nr:MAG: hypothetical protein OJF49_002066 [Ktedonobacterales bacterium]